MLNFEVHTRAMNIFFSPPWYKLHVVLTGSLLLLLLHLLPMAASARSSGSRSHSFAPRLPSVESVSSYAFARKIRFRCGLSVTKRSVDSEREEHQPTSGTSSLQPTSSTRSLLVKLINLFADSFNGGATKGEESRAQRAGELREKRSNFSSSFKAQLAQLRALKSVPIKRSRRGSGSFEMRRNLLEAIATMAAEVNAAIPLTVSKNS